MTKTIHHARFRMGRVAIAVGAACAVVGVPANAFAGTPSAGTPSAGAPTPTAVTLPGSIVFLKSFNVWIANGDGSAARAVTRDGTKANPYYSPSESDTGIIAAARSLDIVRLTQHGAVLNRIDPPPLRNSAGENMDGVPSDVAISPDGMKIAYTFVQYGCPTGTDCQVRFATGYTAATRYAKVGQPVFYRAPSWVTTSRALTTGGFGSQVMLHDISTTAARHWFDDSDLFFPDTDLADGEVAADGKYLAEVRGYGATTSVALYRVNGNALTGAAPGPPTPLCNTTPEAGQASPTWAPDGSAVAWQAKEGIWIHVDPSNCAGRDYVAIRAATRPDWSGAPLG